MYHNILVPLDGSARAEKILPHIEELALKFEAVVLFLNVIEPADKITPEAVVKDMREQEQKITPYLAEVQENFQKKGIRTESRILHGPVVDGIIGTARKENVDLIAIASHGRTGMGQLFYGSIAAGVLNKVDRPLLIIRSRQEGF
ncbi:MAG: universal stress protein [Desulfoferrobacter sp.]